MARFRKKPIIIEASQWFKDGDHPHVRIARYADTQWKVCPRCGNPPSKHGYCQTLEGGMIACPGDWIITGIRDECYPCKPEVFEKSYEPVN